MRTIWSLCLPASETRCHACQGVQENVGTVPAFDTDDTAAEGGHKAHLVAQRPSAAFRHAQMPCGCYVPWGGQEKETQCHRGVEIVALASLAPNFPQKDRATAHAEVNPQVRYVSVCILGCSTFAERTRAVQVLQALTSGIGASACCAASMAIVAAAAAAMPSSSSPVFDAGGCGAEGLRGIPLPLFPREIGATLWT